MLDNWRALTAFMRTAKAPLDNNICERALKTAILHRKNSLFFKSEHGARTADIYMSLIYTCEQAGVNSFDYLVALMDNAEQVQEDPAAWLPWNYTTALATKAE